VVPGHTWSKARAISDDGTYVVGNSRNLNENEGFLWSAGAGMTGLGRFGGVDGDAVDVNNAGHVVGWSDTGGGKWSQTAVLWKDGQMLNLNSLVNIKANLGRAESINNTGHIAGYMDFPKPTSEQHGYVLIPNEH
jgi:probable HAF family extracellular repeat protein